MSSGRITGSTVLKTILELYARQNNLTLEYTADDGAKTFTFTLKDAEGNSVLPVGEKEKPSSVLAHRGRQAKGK